MRELGRLILVLAALTGLVRPIAALGPPPTPTLKESSSTLESRLQALEEMNRRLLESHQAIQDREERSRRESEARYEELKKDYDRLKQQLESRAFPPLPDPSQASDPETQSPQRIFDRLDQSLDNPDFAERGNSRESASSEARAGEGFAPGRAEGRWPLQAAFEDGFLVETPDSELQLRLHVLDQTDFKVFDPGDQNPARSGLYVPRGRFYFEGRLTKQFDYEVSLQRSVDGIWDLLDGNINVHLFGSDEVQIRFGRALVPYSYDWYDHLEQYFITPERGLFPLNFGIARSAGITGHGRIFDERLQYAVGGYDGRLVGAADDNNTRDAVGYLNARPFLLSEDYPALKLLNVGVSGFIGQQIRPGRPLPLRTSLQSSENDEAAKAASAVFLEFNPDAFALGQRQAAAVHLAWYQRSLSLEAEWQIGRFGFATARQQNSTRNSVPVTGYHVTLGYFLTGEEIEGRTTVVPNRPFIAHKGLHGPGAIELFARYSQLHLGRSVFDEGLANPDEWTNNAYMTDIGFNWYLNRWIKIYFDWQHSIFGSPVLVNPNKDLFSPTNDLFWIRCQLYF